MSVKVIWSMHCSILNSRTYTQARHIYTYICIQRRQLGESSCNRATLYCRAPRQVALPLFSSQAVKAEPVLLVQHLLPLMTWQQSGCESHCWKESWQTVNTHINSGQLAMCSGSTALHLLLLLLLLSLGQCIDDNGPAAEVKQFT